MVSWRDRRRGTLFSDYINARPAKNRSPRRSKEEHQDGSSAVRALLYERRRNKAYDGGNRRRLHRLSNEAKGLVAQKERDRNATEKKLIVLGSNRRRRRFCMHRLRMQVRNKQSRRLWRRLFRMHERDSASTPYICRQPHLFASRSIRGKPRPNSRVTSRHKRSPAAGDETPATEVG